MITIIAAVAANNVIGKRGDLPWYFPEDLKRFKALTDGHPVIMGRKTFESILARLKKPLPGRIHFVLTRNPKNLNIVDEFKTQVFACANLDEAIQRASQLDTQLFIIGGEKVFAEALPKADKLELTEVHQDYEGDSYFPEFDQDQWQKTEQGRSEYNQVEYNFATYIRK